jgi:hypothetical protein
MTKQEEVIVKIAKVLLKQEVPNWIWEVVNPILKGKYIKIAKELYDIFKKEDLLK